MHKQLAGTRQAIQHADDLLASQVRALDVDFVIVSVVAAMPDQVDRDLVTA